MKQIIFLPIFALALCLRAADSSPTNAPTAKSDAAAIPDAAHKPVLITNTVTIAGEPVTYTAETGMLAGLEK